MASVKVQIPSALESRIGAGGDLPVTAQSVAEAISHLSQDFPALEQVIFAANGRMRGFINLYLNDTDIRDLDGFETSLNEGDCLAIVPAVAGG